jgi:hypothetical protein
VANEQDIEQIKSTIDAMSKRYQGKGGDIQFAGIEDGTIVQITPGGFCWR